MNVAEWQAFRDLAGVPELKRLVSYFDKVQLRMLCVVQLPPLTGIAFTSIFLVNYEVNYTKTSKTTFNNDQQGKKVLGKTGLN